VITLFRKEYDEIAIIYSKEVLRSEPLIILDFEKMSVIKPSSSRFDILV